MKVLTFLFVEVLVFVAVITVIGLALGYVLSVPDVHRSWTTKECLEVRPSGAGTCEDLPDRYDVVWGP